MFRSRLISSICLIALLAGMVWQEYRSGLFLMVSILALVAQWEFYIMQEAKGLKVFKKAGLMAGAVFLLTIYLTLLFPPAEPRHTQGVETFAILCGILFILSRQVFEKAQNTAVLTVALTLFGFIYVPYLFISFQNLFEQATQEGDGIMLALYLVVVTKVTDIGAYLWGSWLGRHKMIPQISPKKTWEGFAGGILTSIGASVGLSLLLPEQLAPITGIHAVILGLVLSLVSVVGDLAESVIKRDSQSKDSGAVIPGIGGSLDLVDSLLYTGPLFYSYLILVA
ncbi:MAG: phosphatidate cytidylyltransferase [Blastochloris sp.]|nr:phosphatidate cytidylyltransferase [Blastochloris sp.]